MSKKINKIQPSNSDKIHDIISEDSITTKHFRKCYIDHIPEKDISSDKYYLNIIKEKSDKDFINSICKIYKCKESDLEVKPNDISCGKIDLIAGDCIVDLKCYKKDTEILNKKNVAQLYSYYLTFDKEKRDNIKHISLFNPRNKLVYIMDVKDIDNKLVNFFKECGFGTREIRMRLHIDTVSQLVSLVGMIGDKNTFVGTMLVLGGMYLLRDKIRSFYRSFVYWILGSKQ